MTTKTQRRARKPQILLWFGSFLSICFVGFVFFFARMWSKPVLVAIAGTGGIATVVRTHSPSGQVRVEIVLQRHQDAESVPHWRVYFKDRPIILTSRLAIDVAGAPSLGGSCVIESIETNSRRAEYAVFPGKRSRILDHYTETVAALREIAPLKIWMESAGGYMARLKPVGK